MTMKLMRTSALPLLTALCAAIVPTEVLAQDNEEEQKASGFAIDEIVVTARRQQESIQSTPIAVTAISGRGMEERGYSDISQVMAITPNVVFDGASPVSGNSSAPSVFIRGVGQLDFTVAADPGVGIYVDGVYMARSVGGIIDLLDLERVEVLRGPQGTLFGRNTIGGAIQLISKMPDEEFGGYVQATTGSYDRIDVQAALNVPISDTLRTKFTGITRNRDGYVTNAIGQDLGDDNTYSLRAQVLWEPTSDFSLHLTGDYTKDDENGAPNVALTAYPNGNFGYRTNRGAAFGCNAEAAIAPAVLTFLPNADLDTSTDAYRAYEDYITGNPNCFDVTDISSDLSRTNSTTPAVSENEIKGVSGTIEYSFDWATLKSVTAYRTLESRFQRDSDHTAYHVFDTMNAQDQNQFSQELTFSGQSDRFQWVVGGYYFKENAHEDVNIILPASSGTIIVRGIFNIDVENENWALFGETTYDITDRLHLTGGIRYTEEDKSNATLQRISFTGDSPSPVYDPQGFDLLTEPLGPVLVTLVDDPGQTQSVSDTSIRANIAYDLSDQMLAYVTYSQGFKSGGFNPRYLDPTTDLKAIAFDPEYVDMFELGLKMDAFDNRLRLNLVAFMMDYDDIQVSASTPSSAGARVTANAAKASIDGFEAEFTFVPSSNLLIEGALGYLNARYDEYGSTVDFACLPDCDFARIPKVTASLGVSYNIELGDMGSLKPRIDWSHKSSVEGDANNAPQIKHPTQNLISASISYEDDDGDWLVNFGVTNLTNEDYYLSSNNNPRLSYAEVIFGRGREWYLSVKQNF